MPSNHMIKRFKSVSNTIQRKGYTKSKLGYLIEPETLVTFEGKVLTPKSFDYETTVRWVNKIHKRGELPEYDEASYMCSEEMDKLQQIDPVLADKVQAASLKR